ncbi:hypothetical protein L3X38_017013 [Prunus dulcis]|uniref:Uncharacterized protein n=1 Tax=Prunus dulcis TaxID=3755 RepID=A0AAD4W904_PRUDU|nr:hypothetical protein L3X38_017013 [Prunus dulcis]
MVPSKSTANGLSLQSFSAHRKKHSLQRPSEHIATPNFAAWAKYSSKLSRLAFEPWGAYSFARFSSRHGCELPRTILHLRNSHHHAQSRVDEQLHIRYEQNRHHAAQSAK